MNKLLINITSNFILGGVESNIIRMFAWGNQHGYRNILMLPIEAELIKQWDESIVSNNVEVCYFDRYLKNIILDGNEAVIIAYNVDSYLIGIRLIKKLKKLKRIKLYFYVLHPYLISKISMRPILIKIYYKLLLSKIKSKSLIFMDEEVRMAYVNTYRDDAVLNEDNIVRLGMSFLKYNDEYVERRYYSNEHVITTMARFDFPFKGYIFGLIDDVEKLTLQGYKVRLKIIGDGEGRNELEKKVESSKANIELMGYIANDSLEDVLADTFLFVGQGTTLIEAAKYGIPGVIATAYHYKNFAYGLFNEQPEILGAIINEEIKQKTIPFEIIMRSILDMSYYEYNKISQSTYNVAHDTYSIDTIMNRITKDEFNEGVAEINNFRLIQFINDLIMLKRNKRNKNEKVKAVD